MMRIKITITNSNSNSNREIIITKMLIILIIDQIIIKVIIIVYSINNLDKGYKATLMEATIIMLFQVQFLTLWEKKLKGEESPKNHQGLHYHQIIYPNSLTIHF